MNKNNRHIDKSSVPEGYFEGLTDNIMNRIETEESVFLSNDQLRQLPFEVPKNYFSQLTDQVLANSQKKPTKVISLWASRALKIAASLILIIGATFVLNQLNQESTSADLLSQLSDEEVIEFLANDEEILEELFSETEVMEIVLDELMADVAYDYADMIDYEEDFYFEQ